MTNSEFCAVFTYVLLSIAEGYQPFVHVIISIFMKVVCFSFALILTQIYSMFSVVMCPKPDLNFPNGTVLARPSSTFHYGDTVTYLCNLGYNRIGPLMRTCNARGMWDVKPPHCEGRCSK